MLNRSPIHPRPTQGAVLLEVVLALVLFVAAAAVVSSALRSAIDSEERLRLGVHADNLASSVVAELETGLRSPAVLGPTPFEAPFTNWTWQIIPPGGDTPGSPHEIVIRHADPELVRRLAQVILTPSRASSTSEEPLPDETVPAL